MVDVVDVTDETDSRDIVINMTLIEYIYKWDGVVKTARMSAHGLLIPLLAFL